jgi:hypothetical protein
MEVILKQVFRKVTGSKADESKEQKTAKERASLFSPPTTFTVIQPKRLRELMHVKHKQENCMQNFG